FHICDRLLESGAHHFCLGSKICASTQTVLASCLHHLQRLRHHLGLLSAHGLHRLVCGLVGLDQGLDILAPGLDDGGHVDAGHLELLEHLHHVAKRVVVCCHLNSC